MKISPRGQMTLCCGLTGFLMSLFIDFSNRGSVSFTKDDLLIAGFYVFSFSIFGWIVWKFIAQSKGQVVVKTLQGGLAGGLAMILGNAFPYFFLFVFFRVILRVGFAEVGGIIWDEWLVVALYALSGALLSLLVVPFGVLSGVLIAKRTQKIY